MRKLIITIAIWKVFLWCLIPNWPLRDGHCRADQSKHDESLNTGWTRGLAERRNKHIDWVNTKRKLLNKDKVKRAWIQENNHKDTNTEAQPTQNSRVNDFFDKTITPIWPCFTNLHGDRSSVWQYWLQWDSPPLYMRTPKSRARVVKESACKSHHSVLYVQFFDTVLLPQPDTEVFLVPRPKFI